MENNLGALGATKIIDICISLSIWEPPYLSNQANLLISTNTRPQILGRTRTS